MTLNTEALIWTVFLLIIGGSLLSFVSNHTRKLNEDESKFKVPGTGNRPLAILWWFILFFVVYICLSLMLNSHDMSNMEYYDATGKQETIETKNGSGSTIPKQATDKTYLTIYAPQDIKTTFEDVAGLKAVKEEVQDILYYLRGPKEFTRLGAKPPKGMIIEGLPGTGKTLLARALAGEAGVTFIATTGSSFEDTYIGVGASRIRELFRVARANKPCIIFIDEIDSVAKDRNSLFMQNLTQTQTVNQLLAEMDGLDPENNAGIFVIAATNKIEDLDKAILRPGRFDRKIHIDLPTREERKEILTVYIEKVKAAKNLDVAKLAKMTTGFSGAELSDLVNEAAIIATKSNASEISMKDFETAKEKMILGLENPSMRITDKELKQTAYHESGHTIVGVTLTPQEEALYKVTIAPRGFSLGATHFYEEQNSHSRSKKFLENKIAVMLAGRAAEEIVYGKDHVSTGASNDFKIATKIAHDMVTKYGFSETIGTLYHDGRGDEIVAKETIQKEVQKILDNAYTKAKNILESKKEKLHLLTKKLVEKETLDGEEVKAILK